MCQNTSHKTYTLIKWAFNCITDRAFTNILPPDHLILEIHTRNIHENTSNILVCIHQPDLGTPALYGASHQLCRR